MATSKKLEIIYYNGQPDGVRSVRRHLSTITTYVIPRPLLSEAKKISGITRPGIYYLINENDENKIAQIYIGQTRNGVTRLDDHNRSKDFWNKAIVFLADNKTFSLDMISGLEEYAIIKAHEAKRYKVENSVKPKYEIDEYDLPSIEEVYDEIQFVMATLGYKMNDAKQTRNESEIFHTTRNGITAYGIYSGDKFQVLEDSEINITKPVSLPKYNRQREELLQKGDISVNEAGERIGLSQPRVSRHIRSGMEKIRKKYMETMYPAGTAQGMIQKKQAGGRDYAQIWNQREGNP